MTPWDGGSVSVGTPAYLLPYYHWWAAGIYTAYLRNRAPRAPLSMRGWIRVKKDLYVQAHTYIKEKMKRQDGRGTYTNAYAKNIINTTKNGKKITFIGTHPSRSFFKHSFGSDKVLVNKNYKKPTGYTLKSFMENHPVGRFVLIVQGHAVAVVDGVLYGNRDERYNGLYRSVWYGFEMK
jgi:hypothetical protein